MCIVPDGEPIRIGTLMHSQSEAREVLMSKTVAISRKTAPSNRKKRKCVKILDNPCDQAYLYPIIGIIEKHITYFLKV